MTECDRHKTSGTCTYRLLWLSLARVSYYCRHYYLSLQLAPTFFAIDLIRYWWCGDVLCFFLGFFCPLLLQDKRRLEREKTYYWGQAEELRMSAAAGGRADPTRDAEHLQLVEQTRELIEENRELRQRAQVMLSRANGLKWE